MNGYHWRYRQMIVGENDRIKLNILFMPSLTRISRIFVVIKSTFWEVFSTFFTSINLRHASSVGCQPYSFLCFTTESFSEILCGPGAISSHCTSVHIIVCWNARFNSNYGALIYIPRPDRSQMFLPEVSLIHVTDDSSRDCLKMDQSTAGIIMPIKQLFHWKL